MTKLQRESQKLPLILLAENVKALRPYLPIMEAEYAKRGYRMYYTMYNSKYWTVPQNRERYFVIGVRNDLPGDFIFPTEQHDYVPKLSSILETDVDEKYYIADEKAAVIIQQALKKLETLGDCHATITPDRINKRQNGPRAKENEKEMFTLTAQDLHGVIIDDTYGYDGVRPYTDTVPTLRSSRQGVKVVEDAITEVCVNDRGFIHKDAQVSTVVPTLRAENHGNHPKIIQLAHKENSGQKGYVHDADGIVGAVTATDYKDHKCVLEAPDIKVVGMLDMKSHEHSRRVHDTEGISPTATAVAGGTHHIKILDPKKYRVRKLTPTEYGRLQGFPMDNWQQVVSNSQAYKQFGNAVTVTVANALAIAIKEFLDKARG